MKVSAKFHNKSKPDPNRIISIVPQKLNPKAPRNIVKKLSKPDYVSISVTIGCKELSLEGFLEFSSLLSFQFF